MSPTRGATTDRYNTVVKFLIVSDIHANWSALQAVLKHAEGEYQQIICCGDLVGYNARPKQVVDWTASNCAAVIRGNHDKVVAGKEKLEWFNEVAKRAALWTMTALDPEQLAYLRNLQQGPVRLEYFHIWHGSPRDEDEYITNTREAAECFSYFELPLAFFGHTHVQGGFFLTGGKVGTIAPIGRKNQERVLELQPDLFYMVNPGSVGQPRDGDPRAAYVLYNSDAKTIVYRRVTYSIEETAQGIRDAGLPDVLALRLFEGL